MPRKVKDYSKSLVYKLCCKDTTIKEIYVGSTTNFTQRKKNHKSCCNNKNDNNYNLKVYQHIRAFGGWENWEMVLIEFYPCDNELELGRREDYWKQFKQASLNSISPFIHENKEEYQKEYHKEWREEHKEQQKEYQKEWRELNKERILEKGKKYHQKNKEKIAEQKKQKYTCECGSIIRKGDKARHEKSKKHISILEKRSLSGQGIQEILS